MLDYYINSLSFCNLLGGEGINFLLFAVIGKHMVEIAVLSMRAWVLLIIRTP